MKSFGTLLAAGLVLSTLSVSQASEPQRMEGELEAYVIDYPVDNGSNREADSDSYRMSRQAESHRHGQGQAFRGERAYYLRRDDGSRIELNPGESGALEGMLSGERIQVEGYVTETAPERRDGELLRSRKPGVPAAAEKQRRMRVRDVQPMVSRNTRAQATDAAAASHDSESLEKRRALGIIVEFSGSDDGVTRKEARDALFNGSNSSDGIYRIASGGDGSSGGQLGILPPDGGGKEIVRVELDGNPSSCSPHDWASSAKKKAKKSKGVSFGNHQHNVYFLDPNATDACGWAGLGQLGCGGGSCTSWVRGSGVHTTAHELGHNLGLGHTSRMKGGDELEYGEWTLMGIHYDLINPVQRERLGFYDNHADKLATVGAGKQTIDIAGLHEPFDGPKPHAIKLPTGNGDTTYYAYLIDKDPGGDPWGPIGSIVVTTPDGRGTLQRTWLTDGDEFKDSENDILIRVDSRGGDRATLTVRNGDELVAEDAEWTMAPGKEHGGQLSANNAQGREVSFRKGSAAGQGNVTVNSDGSFVYTANGDASGNDSFKFTARADGETSEPAEASITFNQPPKVGNVSERVTTGKTVKGQLDVTDNESNPGKLALEITEEPDKGTVSLTEGTQFAYEANDGASGEDAFRYRARDSFSGSSEGEVTVQIESDADDGSRDDGGGSSDSGSSSSDSGSDSVGSDSGSSGDASDGGGGGAIGWLNLVGLLGMALAARRPRRAIAAGGAHD